MDWQPKNSDLAGVLRRERRDDLTGLLSMMDFMERADREIARGPATFLYFNVENFRLMNQEYGFQAGNQLLVRIAEALLETFGPVPMARLNDDRFIVMTRSTGLEEHIQAVVETVDQVEARMSLAVKVGIYEPPPEVQDVALIMDRAKLACDSIKGIYDKRCAHFTKGLETQRSLRTYIVTNFYRALEEGWIEVWYQPEIRAATREVCGFEALARWRDPERGIISPGDFIPVLERAHLIDRLDLYVIQRVCSDQQKSKERPGWKSSHISVNLSRVDFQLSNMLEEIQSICRAYDVPEGYLHIEITESALNDNDEFLRHEIQRFHDAGFELWMDDFGSGYSSLNNLKDFQFDLLKIDMGFLRDFDTKPQARVILEAIVDMAKKLGIHTLCEGVETEEQYKFLKDIGCEVLQGYLFSPPVPYSDEHTGEVSGSKENRLVIEGTEAEDYFRTIGSFNVLDADPLRFSKDSWGLAIAILECRDDGSCRYLYANDRVREMARFVGFRNLDEAIRDRRHRDDLMQPERRFWNLVERALQSGKPESMENFINGRAYSVRMVRIARDEPRPAALHGRRHAPHAPDLHARRPLFRGRHGRKPRRRRLAAARPRHRPVHGRRTPPLRRHVHRRQRPRKLPLLLRHDDRRRALPRRPQRTRHRRLPRLRRAHGNRRTPDVHPHPLPPRRQALRPLLHAKNRQPRQRKVDERVLKTCSIVLRRACFYVRKRLRSYDRKSSQGTEPFLYIQPPSLRGDGPRERRGE